jgi:hypothetical protein
MKKEKLTPAEKAEAKKDKSIILELARRARSKKALISLEINCKTQTVQK